MKTLNVPTFEVKEEDLPFIMRNISTWDEEQRAELKRLVKAYLDGQKLEHLEGV